MLQFLQCRMVSTKLATYISLVAFNGNKGGQQRLVYSVCVVQICVT